MQYMKTGYGKSSFVTPMIIMNSKKKIFFVVCPENLTGDSFDNL